MTTPEDRTAAYALAFEEGRRAIDKQAEELEQVRGRIGTLFSVAAVVAALPIDAILERSARLDPWGIFALLVAMAALGAVAVCVVVVWWPRLTVFKLDSGVLVGSYIEGNPPASLAEIQVVSTWTGGWPRAASRTARG